MYKKHRITNIRQKIRYLFFYNKTDIKNKNISIKDNKSYDKIKEKSKESKGFNLINEYPTYTIGEDKNLYYNIYNFLNNGIKNGERCWPDYIKDLKNKKDKTVKKTEFYNKIGKIGEGYRKNKVEDLDTRGTKKFIVENGVLYNNRIINASITNKKIIKKFRILNQKK